MLYLKLFQTEQERIACKETQEYVSYTEETDDVNINIYDYSKDYLTFVAKSDGTFQFSGSSTAHTISYSIDNGKTWSTAARNVTVNVNSGDNVLWKGEMTPKAYDGIGRFSASTASFDAQGNTMSLLFGDNFENQTDLSGKNYAFFSLFRGSKVVNAENMIIPATTLSNSCYSSMFGGCTSLTTAPQLHATTLANNCYNTMFQGCTSLTTAPELQATTLVNRCYESMFSGCTNLNYIKAMFTTEPSETYTQNWVRGVASSGTFVKNSAAQWDVSGVNGIPSGWSVETASE